MPLNFSVCVRVSLLVVFSGGSGGDGSVVVSGDGGGSVTCAIVGHGGGGASIFIF